MLWVLPKQEPFLKVGQLVRILRGPKASYFAYIGQVAWNRKTRRHDYYLDWIWRYKVRDRTARYAEKDLEPVLELFFSPVDARDRAQGCQLVVRTKFSLKTLGVIRIEGASWRARPLALKTFLPCSFRSRKEAALELIRRWRAR